ncbi:MAG: hypothetical protein GX053_12805 [Tissierella sp.]|nr:hypothetical protein [Tissierella sp.]
MTIGERLRLTDIDTYNKLIKLCQKEIQKPKKDIKLGCSVEELMQSDSYSRSGRRVKQRSWG